MKKTEKKFAVCGKAKELSPLVILEIVKRYGKYAVCADMADVHVSPDKKKSGLLHITMDNVGRKHPQPFDMQTCTWDRTEDTDLVFFDAEGCINLMEKSELDDLTDNYDYGYVPI